MAKDFYFKFYFKEWLVSTQGMEAHIRGWYFNLLCHQADKHRLPSDIESLADLAGVKISQFENFKECFKRTLKQKFKENEDGTLYNEKMAEVIEDRKENSTKQSKRAVVGVFIKKMRKLHDFTEPQWVAFSTELMTIEFKGLSNEKKYNLLSVRFNRMVKAVINNSNSNSNYIYNSKEKEGVGEKTAYEVLQKNQPAWIEQFEMRCKSQIQDFDVFKTNFEFAVGKDQISFDEYHLLQLRLEKLFSNWDKSPKKNTKQTKTLSNQR